MNIIPKNDLVDGSYYEGMTAEHDEPRVARWNAKDNLFEYAMHHWTDVYLCPMTYWDEINEYYEAFQPVSVVEPKFFEKVDGL